MFSGVFVVDANVLKSPPDNIKIRAISPDWVDVLTERLTAFPKAISTILPVMIDISDCATLENFDATQLAGMTMYTLGGNHIRSAIQRVLGLSEENRNLGLRYLSNLNNVEF